MKLPDSDRGEATEEENEETRECEEIRERARYNVGSAEAISRGILPFFHKYLVTLR